MAKPQPGDYSPFAQTYIDLTKDCEDAHTLIERYSLSLNNFINSLPEAKADYAYAEGKWTIKEVIQHIIDTERIFGYRCLRIARKDTTVLPGFEQDDYVATANAHKRTLQSLKDEFTAVRKASDLLIASLAEEQLAAAGTVNNYRVTANAYAYAIFGHALHHQQLIEARYL